eukprot:Awhi_evm1s4674
MLNSLFANDLHFSFLASYIQHVNVDCPFRKELGTYYGTIDDCKAYCDSDSTCHSFGYVAGLISGHCDFSTTCAWGHFYSNLNSIVFVKDAIITTTTASATTTSTMAATGVPSYT